MTEKFIGNQVVTSGQRVTLIFGNLTVSYCIWPRAVCDKSLQTSVSEIKSLDLQPALQLVQQPPLLQHLPQQQP